MPSTKPRWTWTRLGHDPGEVRALAAVRQVVADDPPARADPLEHVRDRPPHDATEHLGPLADLVGVAREEGLDRDRVGHRSTGSPGVQVTTPTSLGRRPLIVQPSPSGTASSSSAALEAGLLRPGGIDPELAPDEALELVARVEPARLDADHA